MAAAAARSPPAAWAARRSSARSLSGRRTSPASAAAGRPASREGPGSPLPGHSDRRGVARFWHAHACVLVDYHMHLAPDDQRLDDAALTPERLGLYVEAARAAGV